MLILLITSIILVFLLCIILAVLNKKEVSHFRLFFSWPPRLNAELKKSKQKGTKGEDVDRKKDST